MNGMDVCRQARRGSARPLLMLTARDHDIDQVLGLGADDYVKKPVEHTERTRAPKVLGSRARNYIAKVFSSVRRSHQIRFGPANQCGAAGAIAWSS